MMRWLESKNYTIYLQAKKGLTGPKYLRYSRILLHDSMSNLPLENFQNIQHNQPIQGGRSTLP